MPSFANTRSLAGGDICMSIGKPDFLFIRERVVVFSTGVSGTVALSMGESQIATRVIVPKIARNKARDAEVTRALKLLRWRVVWIWEHELQNETRVVAKVRTVITSK